MKLEQFIDKVVDQNGIESKYLWYHPLGEYPKKIKQIDVSTQKINFVHKVQGNTNICHCQALPNNKIFGVSREYPQGVKSYCLFITDDDLNIKVMVLPPKKEIIFDYICSAGSCFYDDSIFIFAHNISHISFKKYDISRNWWTGLANLPQGLPTSCVGFNQKILFVSAAKNFGLRVYDIILDNYSQFQINNFDEGSIKMLIKSDGKCYLISLLGTCKILSCDGDLLNWAFLSESENLLIKELGSLWRYQPAYFYFVHYETSIYFFSCNLLFKFELKELKLKFIKQF